MGELTDKKYEDVIDSAIDFVRNKFHALRTP